MIGSATTETRNGLSVITSETALIGKTPHLFRRVTAYQLGMLFTPDPTYDLGLLLKPNDGADAKRRRSFETIEACLAENRRRSAALVKARNLELPECSELIDDLNEQLDECTADNWFDPYFGPTLGRVSAVSMRQLRLRLLGAIMKFARENPDGRACWVSISHPAWEVSLYDAYWDERHFHVPTIFRSLLRIGSVITAPGYLITYLHTLVHLEHKSFYLQYRGICAGDKLVKLRNLVRTLADPKNARFIEDYTGLDPKHTAENLKIDIREIKDFQFEIPNMMPQMPTVFARHPADASSRRAPEPQLSGYFTWAHLYRYEPIVEMSGVALRCPTANTVGRHLPLPILDSASLSPVAD